MSLNAAVGGNVTPAKENAWRTGVALRNNVQAVATDHSIAHSDMLATPNGQLLIANQSGLLGYAP